MNEWDPAGLKEGGAGAIGAAPRQEARAEPRKAVRGRVKLATDSGFRQEGRMVDLSNSGMSATMEDPVRPGVVCLLDCDVSQHGKTYAISLIAKAIDCILVSGKGYRIGFQFQKVSDGSVAVIRTLLR